MMHCTEKKTNMDIEKMFDSQLLAFSQSETQTKHSNLQARYARTLVCCRLITTFVPFWLIAPRTFENKLFTPALVSGQTLGNVRRFLSSLWIAFILDTFWMLVPFFGFCLLMTVRSFRDGLPAIPRSEGRRNQ